MSIIYGSISNISADVKSASKALLFEINESIGNRALDIVNSQARDIGANAVSVIFSGTNQTPATAEGSNNFTLTVNFQTQGTTITSYAVRSGKRFVLLGLSATVKNAAAASQGVVIRLRANQFTIPSVAAGDAVMAAISAGTMLNIANIVDSRTLYAEGLWPGLYELNYPGRIIITTQGVAAAGCDFLAWGYEY